MCWLWLRTAFPSLTQQLTLGYLTVCVLLWTHHYQSHVHTHREWQTCFAVEGGEQCLQDATDRVQTSVVDLGIRLGTSADRISLNPLNPSAGSGKTGAHFRFTRFSPGSWRHFVCVCVCAYVCMYMCMCHSLAFPSPRRTSCPRNVPPLSKMFSGCPPWTIQAILDAHTLWCAHRWHYSVHTHIRMW